MAAGVEHAAQSMIHVAPPADTAATRRPPRMNHEARQKCCRMQASLNRAVGLYKIRGVQIARPCREVVMDTDCHRHHIHPDRCPAGIVNKQHLLATDKNGAPMPKCSLNRSPALLTRSGRKAISKDVV